jgi:hypothetical protein
MLKHCTKRKKKNTLLQLFYKMVAGGLLNLYIARYKGMGKEYFCKQTYWKRSFSVQTSNNTYEKVNLCEPAKCVRTWASTKQEKIQEVYNCVLPEV